MGADGRLARGHIGHDDRFADEAIGRFHYIALADFCLREDRPRVAPSLLRLLLRRGRNGTVGPLTHLTRKIMNSAGASTCTP